MDQSEIEKNKLRKSEQEYRSLFRYHSDAIFVFEGSGQCLRVNPSAVKITGYSEEQLREMELLELFYPKDHDRVKWYMAEALKGHSLTFEVEIKSQLQHSKLIVQFTLAPIEVDQKANGVMGIVRELAANSQTNLINMSDIDELTGLPNRRFFMRWLERMILLSKENDERGAILFIDLDRFKQANDSLGRTVGDQTLKEISRRLVSLINGHDLVARVGGNEFIVGMTNVSSDSQVSSMAEKCLSKIKSPFLIDGYEFMITGCIGISLFPSHANNAETLVKTANLALDRAKGRGSNAVEYYKSNMIHYFHEHFQVENDLRRAIKNGEFSLAFQPQLSLITNQICGEEVLVRWHHPDNGTIPPDKFIMIAEETGLIVDIGEWVLREACIQKKQWIEKGLPTTPISVNLSLRQFLQHNIVEVISSILEETQLHPSLLKIEVTESVSINVTRTLEVLKQLISIGVKISLDDFGTGYSSLQYISQFPVHELKIDQSFVKNIGNRQNSEGIISLIIRLAHVMDLTVIAEGVETDEQRTYLENQGCDKVQGFLYSKPLISTEYEQFLKQINIQ
ncbi:EAL and GGDEF domain-containing protein [Bacillus suaedae]|uniref:EAL domain-containing protein n=1 Tax=Halalkalibacter suaedae TaxID=2822140 RepID=A0A940WRZ5_9BACI|nr:EAL domain-containing protein [Bacillus suaedae]MBP3949607.1 EAL domain-containing protein [Bacillus suaedae]